MSWRLPQVLQVVINRLIIESRNRWWWMKRGIDQRIGLIQDVLDAVIPSSTDGERWKKSYSWMALLVFSFLSFFFPYCFEFVTEWMDSNFFTWISFSFQLFSSWLFVLIVQLNEKCVDESRQEKSPSIVFPSPLILVDSKSRFFDGENNGLSSE